MKRRRALHLLALNLLAVALAAGLVSCSDSRPQFKSIDITGADYARDFRLPDQSGQVRSLQDFRGKVVVLFFGYTQCPDVCPTTLSELAQAKQLMGPDGERVQPIFVTLDPQRDTPEVLKAYMAHFGPAFLALRGTDEQLASMAKEFKVYYKKVDGKTPTSYTMDHTAASFVYDTQGRLRLYVRYAVGAEPLASDLRILLKE